MPDLEIGLLGGFSASVDGVAVPETAWRLKKARELVKLLALADGHRLHREQAMDALWRQLDPAAAANNLNQAVHVARRALGAEAIEARDGLLVLAAEVDVDRFEEAAAAARRAGTAAAYRAALAAYGGELLPENRYDDFAEARRDELETLRDAVAHELERLEGVAEPLRLPAATSSFVGRRRELAELEALLRRGRLLTLAGTGGAGKTRLALELARTVQESFVDGAALVELAPVSDPGLVGDAVAAALDVRALPGQGVSDALAGFLGGRAMLLVLDNCEHVLAASASLAEALLRAAPNLTVLATTREPLRLPGEVVFRVPSLTIPDPEQLPPVSELGELEAVRLFVERAAAVAPGFSLTEENAADVARICFRLDGLPLAVELAAGRVGGLGPAAIAERLDDRFRLLRAGAGAAPTRQQTLAAALRWSHDLLEPGERVLFRRLAVFAGGFELGAAEVVCAGDELGLPEIADVLGRLVEKSLVSAEERGAERRYRLLETVRLYAQEQLLDAGEARPLALRHAHWALALAEAEADRPALDREAANLRAALDTLMDVEPEEAVRFCVHLLPFWLRRIDLHEGRRRLAEVLGAAPERTALRVEALLAASAVALRSGTMPDGRERVEEALDVALELGDARIEWKVRQRLADFTVAWDDAELALLTVDAALTCARREGLEAPEAVSVYALGSAYWLLGDLDRAELHVAREPGAVPPPATRTAAAVAPQHRRAAVGRHPGPPRPAGAVRGHAPAVPRAPGARGRRARPREPGRACPRARRQRPGARALRRGRADLPRGGRAAGTRQHARPPGVSPPRRGRSRGRARRAAARARAGPCPERPARDRHGAHRPRARRHGRRRATSARSASSGTRSRSSAGQATVGGLRARSGGGPISPSSGASSTTPRKHSRKRCGCSARRSACAGPATRSAATGTCWRRAATWRPRGAGTRRPASCMPVRATGSASRDWTRGPRRC